MKKKNEWSKEELNLLCELYPKLSNDELLNHFNRSKSSIYYKANSNLKLNMANKLIENDIPKELIPAILTSLTKENVKLLDLMLEDPKFDKALIPQILHNSWTHDFIQRPSVSSSYVKNAIYLIKNDDFPNNCISDLQQVMSSDINFVKPSIGETTRVLLRRMPWKILVRSKRDEEHLGHIYQLAKEKGIEVIEYPLTNYRACGLIQSIADN